MGSNKGLLVVLGGCVVAVIAVMATITGFIPSFVAPFAIALYGLWIIYMTR